MITQTRIQRTGRVESTTNTKQSACHSHVSCRIRACFTARVRIQSEIHQKSTQEAERRTQNAERRVNKNLSVVCAGADGCGYALFIVWRLLVDNTQQVVVSAQTQQSRIRHEHTQRQKKPKTQTQHEHNTATRHSNANTDDTTQIEYTRNRPVECVLLLVAEFQ